MWIAYRYDFTTMLYSRLSLNGHLCKMDTLMKQTPRVDPCLSLLPLFHSLYDKHHCYMDPLCQLQRCLSKERVDRIIISYLIIIEKKCSTHTCKSKIITEVVKDCERPIKKQLLSHSCNKTPYCYKLLFVRLTSGCCKYCYRIVQKSSSLY